MMINDGILMFEAAYPPPIIGGKEKQAHILSKELHRKNAIVEAISYIHNGNRSGSYEGISIIRLKPGFFIVPILSLLLIKKRSRFKILHIHTPSRIGKLTAFIGFLLRYKVVFKIPSERLFKNLNLIESFYWNVVLKVVDTFIVLESFTKNFLLMRGIQKKRIFNVSNGVEIPKYPLHRETNRKFNILFVGRLVPLKCCSDLIKACSLIDRTIEWNLTIVGDGPLFYDLIQISKHYSISERVVFEGYHSDTIAYMHKADMIVIPSKYEGMSNVILEAMSVGLPIIATNVGSAKKQLGEFGKDFLCSVGKPEEIFEKIQSLISNKDLRIKYSSYLYSRCKEEFSISAIASQYMERYEQLLTPIHEKA